MVFLSEISNPVGMVYHGAPFMTVGQDNTFPVTISSNCSASPDALCPKGTQTEDGHSVIEESTDSSYNHERSPELFKPPSQPPEVGQSEVECELVNKLTKNICKVDDISSQTKQKADTGVTPPTSKIRLRVSSESSSSHKTCHELPRPACLAPKVGQSEFKRNLKDRLKTYPCGLTPSHQRTSKELTMEQHCIQLLQRQLICQTSQST